MICKQICRIPVWKYMKIYIPCLPLAHAFWRIGCALTGCCYGIPYDGPGAVIYDHSIIAPDKVRLFPVQLTETVINLLITVVLLFYIFNRKGRTNHSIAIYCVLYGTARFILEFLRCDLERGKFLWFSTSQWISLILIDTVIIYGLKRREITYAG